MTTLHRILRNSVLPALALIAILCICATITCREAQATPCSTQSVLVTRVSSPIFYFDPGLTPKLSSGYVGYRITNNSGSAIEELWAAIDNFSGTVISRAPYENGVSHVGPLGVGQSTVVYFYLSANRQTATPQTHDVVLYYGSPERSPVVCEQTFSLTTYDTISANPNKVFGVSISPTTPEVGGLLTITVQGNTGQVGSAGIFAFTPAVLSSWRADAFELSSVRMTLTGSENRTVQDTLFLSGIKQGPSNYVQTYTFRVKGNPSTSTKIYPANYISSGNEIKHTDTSSFGGLPSIPSPENKVILSSFTTSPATPVCLPSGGGSLSLNLTITNAGTVPARLDDIEVSLPVSPTVPPYEVGSSVYNGQSIGDPILDGSMLGWYRVFDIPAASSRTLSFTVTLPAAAGAYNFSAVGHIDDQQIDSTLTQTTSAPAVTTACVGVPPTATPTPTAVPSPPATDPDEDNDGMTDNTEGSSDPDGDGKPNDQDLDSDGDGIPDIIEAGGEDEDKDGHPDSPVDTDNDGIPNEFDPDNGGSPLNPPDSDGDGKPDFSDRDSDGDGIPDVIEAGGEDDDGDGLLDPTEDNDGDGLDDSVDPDQGGDPLPIPDTDGDGTPDYDDGDSDGDGIPDIFEGQADGDQTPPSTDDSDGDGIDDAFDPDSGGDPVNPNDTDSDGVPDYRDTDSDNDGRSDTDEAFDKDGDGDADNVPSGNDSDKDGIDDSFESIDMPSEIDPDQRGAVWEQACSVRSLSRKLRSTRSAITALYRRVSLFAGRSRQCGGPALAVEVASAKSTYDLIMERLGLEFGGDTYRCPENLCFTSSTTRGKRSINKLIVRLTNQAVFAKKQAIVSCKTPKHPPGFRDNRMQTDDYRLQAARALRDLPNTMTRCP